MSADDGYIIRKKQNGKWVAQHYFLSADALPDIREAKSEFVSVEDCIAFYRDAASETEYGFGIQYDTPDSRFITQVGQEPLDRQQAEFVIREQTKVEFEKALAKLINQYGMEKESNTPDYLLAAHLCRELDSFNIATALRAFWHGNNDEISYKGAEEA